MSYKNEHIGTLIKVLLAGVVILGTTAQVYAAPGKTLICHATGSMSKPWVHIWVADSAVATHIDAQGDVLPNIDFTCGEGNHEPQPPKPETVICPCSNMTLAATGTMVDNYYQTVWSQSFRPIKGYQAVATDFTHAIATSITGVMTEGVEYEGVATLWTTYSGADGHVCMMTLGFANIAELQIANNFDELFQSVSDRPFAIAHHPVNGEELKACNREILETLNQ